MRNIETAYSDGYRCGRKGLGLTKSGRFDYNAQHRLFERIGFGFYPNQRVEAVQEWGNGWFDGINDRLIKSQSAPLTIRELG